MTDPQAVLLVVDELLWAMRREGFAISTAQAIDVARAVRAVGLEAPAVVREAVAAVVVSRARDRVRFDAAFAAFFSWGAAVRRTETLWDRLAARGFEGGEIDQLRTLLDRFGLDEGEGLATLRALLERGADFDRALAGVDAGSEIDAHSGLQLGFLTHRLLGRVGAGSARRALAALRAALVVALGARGRALADALAAELSNAEQDAHALVRRRFEEAMAEVDRGRSEGRSLVAQPFESLSDAEIDEVRRAVRRFAERLRGGAKVRARRRVHRGRIDAKRTLRRALRTAGVPFELVHHRRLRERPKMVLLCDLSESVRAAACFLLEFAYSVQELFANTRSFVFVSELAEATQALSRAPARVALGRVWGGALVGAGENSNYGRALRAFEAGYGSAVDRRTTVVILGDGRTNYQDAAVEVVERLRARSRAVIWLCPEPRGQWGQGDSAMALYAARCTSVHVVRCALDLERAARTLVARGR